MTKQAQVGLFTIFGLIGAFAIFYVLGDLGTRTRGYKIGVHFESASGIHRAAPVSLSGVPIGAVDDVQLEPDYTTEVILAIKPGYEIPKNSKFLIIAPLTGEPAVIIVPPKKAEAETLPHEVLALDKQPQGTNPVSLQDLLEQGQGEIKRFDKILAQLEKRTPMLLANLDSTLKNANELSATANTQLKAFATSATSMVDSLNLTANRAGTDVIQLTNALNETVKRNSHRVDELLADLTHTTKSFNASADSLRDVATNPKVKKDLMDTTHSLALTARTFADLAGDLRQVTGNSQTQAQLRDTVARFDATAQKVDSLLKSLGGKSSVYGVDPGATPPPPGPTPWPPGFVPTSQPAVPVSKGSPAPNPMPQPLNTDRPHRDDDRAPNAIAGLKNTFEKFTKDLIEIQVRVGQLSPQRPGSAGTNLSPLLRADRGPQSDFNLRILPKGGTSLFLGANDIGSGTSTANFMLINRRGFFQYGAGVEYSRLGLMGSIANSKVGLEARAYDLRHPTVDAYGNIFVTPKLQLFGGERDLNHSSRRTVFGLQFEL
jgi:ABC-type transporter Mla subunit MlaD